MLGFKLVDKNFDGENFWHLEAFSSLFLDQIYNLFTSTRINCPNEMVSFTSSKMNLVIRNQLNLLIESTEMIGQINRTRSKSIEVIDRTIEVNRTQSKIYIFSNFDWFRLFDRSIRLFDRFDRSIRSSSIEFDRFDQQSNSIVFDWQRVLIFAIVAYFGLFAKFCPREIFKIAIFAKTPRKMREIRWKTCEILRNFVHAKINPLKV